MYQLFPKVNGFIHGGDYNPDQWLDRPDILEKDVELMKKAHINCVTLGVFSWSAYEREEGKFSFDWLKSVMDNLYENGIYTILATPSGARPAWLDEKYPDAMRVDAYGHRNRHSSRHNHCMTSVNYRKQVAKIDTQLAEKFSEHPGLILWHISNEFGGACYCDSCKKRFQEYLAEKFNHDIDKLNHAWWTGFWSRRFTSFEQVEPPYSNGEDSILGLNLEWKRFTTWSTNDFMRFEIDTLRKVDPKTPVTTNFMTMYEGLDYHQMMDSLDIISWDSYPRFHNDYESLQETFARNAFNHALFRSMKPDRPFMLMESAPGLVNWAPVNKYKRPGIHRLACLQAVASGSDTVQYFQIRKGRGAFEQHHGAVIDHLGTDDTRVFREVAEVGEMLEKIGEVTGSLAGNPVALLFDWDNRWAIKDAMALAQETKKYEETCIDIWKTFLRLGVEPDIVSSDMDWSGYKVILAPMLYVLHDGIGDKVKEFVRKGGRIIATYFSGYVDQNLLCHLGGFPGDGLSEVFGVISEEIDSFYPADRNHILWKDSEDTLGKRIEVRDYAELLRVKDAKVLASYTEDYIQGSPAVTVNDYGPGRAYYLACRTEAEDLAPFFREVLEGAGISPKILPKNVEYHVRKNENAVYEFYLNLGSQEAEINGICGEDLLTGDRIDGSYMLQGMQVLVVKKEYR